MPPYAKSRFYHDMKVRERIIRFSRSRYHALLVSRVLEALCPQERVGGRLLDLGCGCGDKTAFWSLKAKEIIGLDLQNIFYKPYISQLSFCKADALHLPFADQTFNYIISLDALEHIEDDVGLIQEAWRVLKPSGTLIIETPNSDRLSSRILRILNRRKYTFPRCYGNDPVLGPVLHVREYTKKQLLELLSYFDFTEIQIKALWLGLVTPEVGIEKPPEIFENLCQSWLVRAVK